MLKCLHGTPVNNLCAECQTDEQTALIMSLEGTVERLRAENERLMAVVEAAKCIRHWHDREPDGMVVSAEHVRLLWVALAALDQERKEGDR